MMGKHCKKCHISGKVRPVEGLLEATFSALYDGEREKVINFEFVGLGQNYGFWTIGQKLLLCHSLAKSDCLGLVEAI